MTRTQQSRAAGTASEDIDEKPASILRQPKSVWAVAFASVIAFMGIGLVDPILPAIARQLNATSSQTMLLFTSYLVITGLAMFFTSWFSSKFGAKKTLLAGLIVIVVFAALAGASGSVEAIIGFRAGWGLGNALFISTALATIVGAAAGGTQQAIILYEAALGVGIAIGPLVGGLLGGISWRGPFFGVAILMAFAFILIVALLPKGDTKPQPVKLTASLRGLAHGPLLVIGIGALFYNFAFFTMLAYSPFPLEAAGKAIGLEIGAHELGLVFFGWGIALALTSVVVAQPLAHRFGRRAVMYAMLALLAIDEALMALFPNNFWMLVGCIIAGGLFLGVMNTVLTESVMEATDLPRAVASGAYSGVRFIGGAIAPAVAGPFAAATGMVGSPYWLGCGSLVISLAVFAIFSGKLRHVDHHHKPEPVERHLDDAASIAAADAS